MLKSKDIDLLVNISRMFPRTKKLSYSIKSHYDSDSVTV